MIVAFIFFCAAYMGALLRVEQWWAMLVLAAVFEHLAVLIYVFRVWWQTEDKKWKSSISSLN
jgi:hypothetical protein